MRSGPTSSADYANEVDYPSGPIKRGGVTDKLLGDYANLFGDLSANSGNNALSRDAEFTRDFLRASPGQADVRQRLRLRGRQGHAASRRPTTRARAGWPASAWRAKR